MCGQLAMGWDAAGVSVVKQWSQEEITLGTIIYPLYYNLVTTTTHMIILYINHAHHVLLLYTGLPHDLINNVLFNLLYLLVRQ